MGEYSELTSIMVRIFLAGGIVVAAGGIVLITILILKG